MGRVSRWHGSCSLTRVRLTVGSLGVLTAALVRAVQGVMYSCWVWCAHSALAPAVHGMVCSCCPNLALCPPALLCCCPAHLVRAGLPALQPMRRSCRPRPRPCPMAPTACCTHFARRWTPTASLSTAGAWASHCRCAQTAQACLTAACSAERCRQLSRSACTVNCTCNALHPCPHVPSTCCGLSPQSAALRLRASVCSMPTPTRWLLASHLR